MMNRKDSVAWCDDTVVAAEMHECKEAQQSVVIGIEVSVIERLVLCIPEGIYKFLAFVVAAEHRGGSGGGNKADAVAELAESACLQNLVTLRQCAVGTVLVHEGVDSL